MTDRQDAARRLIRQKAILDVLREADSEDRVEAHALYRAGDADSDPDGLGRVRMDKGRKGGEVVDWAALDRWVRVHAPEAIIVRESVNPALVKALCANGGEWTDPATGEVLTVPGIGTTETPGRLVVTTTEAAEEWARAALGAIGFDARRELES